jgi:hypothetical protein
MPSYTTTEHPVADLHLFTTSGRVVAVVPATMNTMERQEGLRPNRFVRSYTQTVLIIEEVDDPAE